MADDARDYVAQLYQQELGRSGADDAGLQAWADAIASGGMSREAVAQAIGRSQEAAAYDVNRLYQQELGRSTKDDAAAQNWVSALTSGAMTEAQLQQALGRSQEGAKYDVDRIYQSELLRGREKDTASEGWAKALMSGDLTEQGVLEGIRASEEYKLLNAPKPTPTPTPTPTLPTQEQRYEQMRADAMARYETQIKTLQDQALKNAMQGSFTPTAPLTMAAPVGGATAGVAGAPAGTATAGVMGAPDGTFAANPPPPAPTPAPVPQTYFAPPPPQYRGFSPFEGPYQSPFESYYSIAMRGPGGAPQQGYSYAPPALPTAAMTTPVPTTTS